VGTAVDVANEDAGADADPDASPAEDDVHDIAQKASARRPTTTGARRTRRSGDRFTVGHRTRRPLPALEHASGV
jgi:hypothetical protein